MSCFDLGSIWLKSMGNHGAVGVSSEHSRSSFNKIWYQKQVERCWMGYGWITRSVIMGTHHIRFGARISPGPWAFILWCCLLIGKCRSRLPLICVFQVRYMANVPESMTTLDLLKSGSVINTLRLRRNGWHFTCWHFQMHFIEWKCMNFD